MISIRGDLSTIEEIIFLTPEHISGDLCQFCKCYILPTQLRKVAKPVEEVNAEIKHIVDDMFETMYAEEGIPLAATQLNPSTYHSY
ncbi:peptide deformylase [Escherichia coli]